jgi:hypothetical protein
MLADTRARRAAAAALLAAGAAEAFLTTRRLGELHRRPDNPLPYFCLFGAALSLAFIAGRLSPAREDGPPAALTTRRLSPAAGAAAILLLAATLLWQSQPHPSLWILATWVGAIGACAAAFPGGQRRIADNGTPAPGRGRAVALAAVLAAAAYARLAGLDAVPPYFGINEADQTLDGVGLVCGEGRTGSCGKWWNHALTDPFRMGWYPARSDPFGAGWFSMVRLGMLPAGAGVLALEDRIRGPRLPYAIAGALSVALCAAAAGLLAGWWGAIGSAALLAFLPHHVHFSRLAINNILDALSAALVVLLLLAARRSLSPRAAGLAGIAGGLALYGYFCGRTIALAFLLAAPFVLTGRRARGRRGLLALALAAGFCVAAAPTLRFILAKPGVERGAANWQVHRVSITNSNWWGPRVAELGSPVRVVADQLLAGTIGLLSQESTMPLWFSGSPILRPALVPALALVGWGWLLGRRQLFAALLLGLLAAANLAALILSNETPAPQRMSFLPAVLVVAGGAAVAGFLLLLPEAIRTAAGALVIGGVLVATFGGPAGVWEPSPGYSLRLGAFLRSAYGALSAPRFAGQTVFLHGRPYVNATVPLFGYLMPQIRWIDVDPPEEGGGESLSPGLHVFSPDWLESGLAWRHRCPSARGFALGDPADPRADVALLLCVPDPSPCRAP